MKVRVLWAVTVHFCWGAGGSIGLRVRNDLRGRPQRIGASEGTGERYIADTACEEWCCVRWDGTAVCD